jgi:hypothetical protein
MDDPWATSNQEALSANEDRLSETPLMSPVQMTDAGGRNRESTQEGWCASFLTYPLSRVATEPLTLLSRQRLHPLSRVLRCPQVCFSVYFTHYNPVNMTAISRVLSRIYSRTFFCAASITDTDEGFHVITSAFWNTDRETQQYPGDSSCVELAVPITAFWAGQTHNSPKFGFPVRPLQVPWLRYV